MLSYWTTQCQVLGQLWFPLGREAQRQAILSCILTRVWFLRVARPEAVQASAQRKWDGGVHWLEERRRYDL